MERKIDVILSRILPGGLPDYPGLPKRWYLYPYGLFVFAVTVLFSIIYISSNAFAEYSQNPMFVSVISSAYLIPLLALFFVLARSCFRWLIPLSIPNKLEEYASFAAYVKHNGNPMQTILLGEFILKQFPDENVSAIEINLGVAYLQVAKKGGDYFSNNRTKGVFHLKQGMQTKDIHLRIRALQTLREHYASREEIDNVAEVENELKKITVAYGLV